MARPPHSGTPWNGFSTAWAVTGTLLSGILVWGGIGLLADLLAGFHWLFLPIGMLVGMGGGIYLVVRRYGSDDG